MTYEKAKELKDAGFPQEECEGGYVVSCMGKNGGLRAREFIVDENALTPIFLRSNEVAAHPTLSELIEACGDGFKDLTKFGKHPFKSSVGDYPEGSKWMTNNISSPRTYGETPEEAVSNLWLELNKK